MHPTTLRVRGHAFTWDPVRPRTVLMGIVNVTPDSFSDGGRFLDPETAARHARALVAEGAELIDVGAESTRPGSRPVSAAEEQDRLLPVLERLLKEPPCPVSVDTTKPEVAEAALALGAHMVNDVTGLAAGPDLARACARHGAALCLVHMLGTPATMQAAPHYDDLLGEVRARLAAAVETAEAAGVAPDAICVDPGIGFGKTVTHNLTLLKRVDALAAPRASRSWSDRRARASSAACSACRPTSAWRAPWPRAWSPSRPAPTCSASTTWPPSAARCGSPRRCVMRRMSEGLP